MEISAKDKKLLVYLLAVCLIAGSYFFAARPLLDKQMEYSGEIADLRSKVNHYNEIYLNRSEYENRIAEAQIKYNETANKFFGGLNQDNTIMMVKDIEETSDVWIARLSFQDENIVYGAGTGNEETVTEEGSEDQANNTAITGLRQDLNIDYAAKYADFKRFIEYIENYDERLFITSINATYAVDSGLVGGSIVLSQFAVTGTDKEYKAPDLSNVNLGNSTIFKTGTPLLTGSDDSEANSSTNNIELEEVNKENDEESSAEPSGEETRETQEEQPEQPEQTQNPKPAGGGIL